MIVFLIRIVDRESSCIRLPAFKLFITDIVPFQSNEKTIYFHSNAANTRRGFSVRGRQIKCDLGTGVQSHPSVPKDQGHDVNQLSTSAATTTNVPFTTRKSCDLYMDKVSRIVVATAVTESTKVRSLFLSCL